MKCHSSILKQGTSIVLKHSVHNTASSSLLRKNKLHYSIIDCPKKDSAKKLDEGKLCFIDQAMAANNQLTARQLWMTIQEKGPDLSIHVVCLFVKI